MPHKRYLWDQGRILVKRMRQVGNDGQWFVGHADGLNAGLCRLGGIRSDGSDRITNVAHVVVGQDIGVADRPAEGSIVHKVTMRDRRLHAGNR